MRLFRDALQGLIPTLERARIAWREPDAYHDWDEMSEAVYRSIVIRSLEFAVEVGPFLSIPNYGFSLPTYESNSFVSEETRLGSTAFICFETQHEPFDHAYFAVLDGGLNVVGKYRLATTDAKFIFWRRTRDVVSARAIDAIKVEL
ncbi:hypothetical protein [Tardiphaga sp.]|uniref:hypothetical protein n=1 Tax=Tardiphaga sp. TaxID=1926292 RepID=UPI00260939DC|nr:hypothetical protein [Tardiphaga sp.]MDB5620618.1 hypothetical protein [Tardiphaga sp.]